MRLLPHGLGRFGQRRCAFWLHLRESAGAASRRRSLFASNGRDARTPALPEHAADHRGDAPRPGQVGGGEAQDGEAGGKNVVLSPPITIEDRAPGVVPEAVDFDRDPFERIGEVDASEKGSAAPDLELRNRRREAMRPNEAHKPCLQNAFDLRAVSSTYESAESPSRPGELARPDEAAVERLVEELFEDALWQDPREIVQSPRGRGRRNRVDDRGRKWPPRPVHDEAP